MAGNRTYIQCPVCRRFGSAELGGYCKDHAKEPEKEEGKHIFDPYFSKYEVDRPFIPDSFGIIKDKCDIVE